MEPFVQGASAEEDGVCLQKLDFSGRQKWEFSLVQGSVYTVDQWSSGKYLDAFLEASADVRYNYSAALRLGQGDGTQWWYLQPRDNEEWRFLHIATGRYLDAYQGTEGGGNSEGEVGFGWKQETGCFVLFCLVFRVVFILLLTRKISTCDYDFPHSRDYDVPHSRDKRFLAN